MQIDSFALGDFETNCYVLRSSPQAKECLIIDPGYSPEPLLEFLAKEELQPSRILLTHGHCDHIAGIPLIKEQFRSIVVAISSLDAQMLTKSRHNLSLLMGQPFRLDQADEEIKAGRTIETDQIKLLVLATPGHTPGSVSFYCKQENVVFTGDALFAGSIGRTDFPGGSSETLLASIREQLLVLPQETKLYSGHGPAGNIGREKRTNPFLR